MGRYPWLPVMKDFLEGVRPYYGETTHRTMTRALKIVHEAFLELKTEGRASTTNPRKLTQKDVEEFLGWMKTRRTRNGTGLNPTTMSNYVRALEELLRWAGNPVIAQMRAMHHVRFPQKVPSQVRVLTEAEVEELRRRLEGMPGWAGSVARFMVAVYGYSGLRRSELRRAGIVDLDTKDWKIVVRNPKGKGVWASSEAAATILVPARAEVLAFLKERMNYLHEHGFDDHEALVPYVFKDGRVGYFTDGMWGSVKDDAQKHAGMPFKIQQLRASFGQMCIDRGSRIESVSRALRHTTTVTTEKFYCRIRPDDAFRELEEVFERPRRAR